jgi:hypothetical protein
VQACLPFGECKVDEHSHHLYSIEEYITQQITAAAAAAAVRLGQAWKASATGLVISWQLRPI